MKQATCWKSRSYVLSKLSARSARFLSTTALLCLTGTGVIAAQTQNQWHDAESIAAKSRAEQAAELQVALSPEKIIELLRQEPGLLLQVKKTRRQRRTIPNWPAAISASTNATCDSGRSTKSPCRK
jgi:hypothetical protein